MLRLELAWPPWLETSWAGHPLREWLTAAGVTLLILLTLVLFKRLVAARLARLAARTETGADDFLIRVFARTRWLLIAVPAVYLGSLALALTPRSQAVLRSAAILALLVQAALWALVAINVWVQRTQRRRGEDAATATLIGVMSFVAKLVLWTLVFLLALDNLGIDVTALLTGLGVGGIAVALAVQKILGDLLGSLTIVMDKPFVVGEAITVGDVTGTVEKVGLRATHVRSVSGELVVLSNGELLQGRIRNWARLAERRVVLAPVLDYGTPAEVVAQLPAVMRSLIEGREQVRFDRAHFKGFGAIGLEFEAIYWITVPDYVVFMDRQQAINLEVVKWLEERGVAVATSARVVGGHAPVGSADPSDRKNN
ncbi:MAG TPA: mechanosensitive ion channel family protein [Thermoanaerobaculia bacterium]|nr:mechanosensitive ion channel family protein [Thermoanaerobaculia bacterium]